MTTILVAALLAATGIYNPPVMRHGHRIAEPGSFDALYCVPPRAAPVATHHRHSHR